MSVLTPTPFNLSWIKLNGGSQRCFGYFFVFAFVGQYEYQIVPLYLQNFNITKLKSGDIKPYWHIPRAYQCKFIIVVSSEETDSRR